MRPLVCAAIREIRAIPDEFVERLATVHAWRSAARFAVLARRRFEGDDALHAVLEPWRYRDEHLQRYEAGLVRGALGHRRETYRVLAAELAAQYQTLVVDDTDLRDLARAPAVEAERGVPIAGDQRHQAAPSELRGALINAFGADRVVTLSARDVTRTCHDCRSIETWDHAADRAHTCGTCGTTWDQDANACRNLLREHRRAQQTPETARVVQDVAPVKETRSDRLRRARRAVSSERALESS